MSLVRIRDAHLRFRFAGERGVVHLQERGLNQPGISRNAVPFTHQEEIARHLRAWTSFISAFGRTLTRSGRSRCNAAEALSALYSWKKEKSALMMMTATMAWASVSMPSPGCR